MTHRSRAITMLGWAALAAGCSYDYGCKCPTDRCADIPPGAIPPPAGTYSCRWQTEQIARAQQDFFVIHQTEWYLGGKELGPDGRKHIREIAKRLSEHASSPVIVSATVDDKLNAARKQVVVESLLKLGVLDADSRVVSGESEAEGLYGQEAVRDGTARLQGGGTGTAGAGGGLGAAGGGLGTPGSGFGTGTTFGGGTGLGGGMGVY
jgi:hypothetical protein